MYVPIDNNKEFVFEGVGKASTILKLTGLLNSQYEEITKLKSEINMLKTTISRNEAYIERLTHKGEWR